MSETLAALGLSTALRRCDRPAAGHQGQAAMTYGGHGVADLQHQIDAGREGSSFGAGTIGAGIRSAGAPRLALARLRLEQWLWLRRPLWLERLIRRSGSPLRASPWRWHHDRWERHGPGPGLWLHGPGMDRLVR